MDVELVATVYDGLKRDKTDYVTFGTFKRNLGVPPTARRFVSIGVKNADGNVATVDISLDEFLRMGIILSSLDD